MTTLSMQPGHKAPGGNQSILPHQARAARLHAMAHGPIGGNRNPFGQLLEATDSCDVRPQNRKLRDQQVLANIRGMLEAKDNFLSRKSGLGQLARLGKGNNVPAGAIRLVADFLVSEEEVNLRKLAFALLKVLPGNPADLTYVLNRLFEIFKKPESANSIQHYPENALTTIGEKLLENRNMEELLKPEVFQFPSLAHMLNPGMCITPDARNVLISLAGRTKEVELIQPLWILMEGKMASLDADGAKIVGSPMGPIVVDKQTGKPRYEYSKDTELCLLSESIGRLAAFAITEYGGKITLEPAKHGGLYSVGLELPTHTKHGIQTGT